jgi:hypothetical protein
VGGIAAGHVEWAIINRLKAMLDEPPETKFNVTQTFALFSAVLLWTKNRGWVAGNAQHPNLANQVDVSAHAFRQQLAQEQVTSLPWALSQQAHKLIDGHPVPAGTPVNHDFAGMPVATFVKWLRDAIGHGDGRTITPLHKATGPAHLTWLSGFRVQFNETLGSQRVLDLHLYEPDMRRIGSLLADRFCAALAKAPGYSEEDVATRVVENEQAA